MIVRVFRARLKPGRRAAYQTLLARHGFPFLRAAPGMVALHVAGPHPERPDELVLTTVWQSLTDLRACAGERWQEVMVMPGEAELVEEMSACHFDETFRPIAASHATDADEA